MIDPRDHRRLSATAMGNRHYPQPGPLCDPRIKPKDGPRLALNLLVAMAIFVLPLVLWVML